MKEKLEQFTFEDMSSSSKYTIENFIVSDGHNPGNLSFDYPFIFKGIVFAVCLRGTGHIQINFKEYTVVENTIVTIPPNQIVQVIDHSEDFLIEMLAFSPDYIIGMSLPKNYDIPKKIVSSPVLSITKEESEEILRYHTFIVTAFKNKRHIFFEHVIKGLLYSLLMVIAAKYIDSTEDKKDKASTRSEEIVDEFFPLLRDYHMQERSASFYADKLCITTKYLSGTLKKVTGRSVNAWLEDAIVMSAKILLKSSDLTVLQISDELNFPNPSYFGRFFKKVTGMTPKEYRDKR
ncbi:MAG TPA: AraC family transcriptional regulator [Dysgonomonas sp.]|nr:AraC family transcriptional regulator [Dysgonomonas sp.]